MSVTVFYKQEVIAQGEPKEFADALLGLEPLARSSDLLAFDDETGKQVDLDLRPEAVQAPRPRGRPSLGVEAREITLLPRHWEWLSKQRGGASATLRKLVEAELRNGRGARDRQDAAYHFLSVMAGDSPRFEEAVRELYADNQAGYDHFAHGWPAAIRDHGRKLAWPER